MGSGAGTSETSTSGRRLRRILLASGIAFATTMAAGSVAEAAAPVAPEPPADVTVECASDVPPPEDLTATDEDGDITVSPTDVSDPVDETDPYDITRTWTFVDSESEETSVSQKITVDDTTPPTGTVQAAITVVGEEGIPAAATITGTDNCDGTVDSVPPTDNPDPTAAADKDDQEFVRSWAFTDAAGNESAPVTQTITVIPVGADLSITAVTAPPSVVAGNDDEVVYTITVTNNGPDTATDVEVTTAPIAGATTSAACTNDPTDAATCSLGALDNGQTASYTVTVEEPAEAAGNIVRTWEVSSAVADQDESNNTVDTTVDVTAEAAMTVTASVVVTELPPETTTTTAAQATSALAAGDPVEITITVGNNGPSAATDATVAATFTNSISDLQVVNDGLYTCAIASQVLSCTLASHPVGQNVAITLSGALTSSSTDIFVGPVVADSAVSDAASTSSILITVVPPTTTTTTVPETTTTVVDTTTIPTTTIPATTIVVFVPTTVAPAGGGAIPATGSDNGNVIRASLIALLAGIAAVVIARRRPELVAAFRPSSWGSGRPADLPTRHVKSNGVSTVIEEPTRRNDKH